MGYREMLKDIKQNELKAVYLLYGPEMYLKDMVLSKLKTAYLDSSFETLNYSYIDGKYSSQDDIINACETLPFMADKKLVVVEDLPIFKAGKKGESSDQDDSEEKNSQGDDILSNYISNIADTTCLVFIWNGEKLDNRRKIIKDIKKIGRIIELEKLKNEELDSWTASQFKTHKKSISRNEISYFLTLTSYLDRNTDKTLYDLENEIKKTVNYIGDREEVTRKDIDSTKPKNLENDIFKLVDYISQKNTSKTIELFNEMLLSGEAAQKIMYMIIRQMRLLLASKLLREKGYDVKTIGQKINIYHNFIIQKLISQGTVFSEKELIRGLEKCRDTDRDMKTGKIDPKLGMEILIVELSYNNKK